MVLWLLIKSFSITKVRSNVRITNSLSRRLVNAILIVMASGKREKKERLSASVSAVKADQLTDIEKTDALTSTCYLTKVPISCLSNLLSRTNHWVKVWASSCNVKTISSEHLSPGDQSTWRIMFTLSSKSNGTKTNNHIDCCKC